MIEQRLADNFRAAVDDEPPLGFDPDDVVDKLGQRRRRRLSVVGAVGAATAAIAATAVVTLGGSGPSGPGQVPVATQLTTVATETVVPPEPPKPGAFETVITVEVGPGGEIRSDKADPAIPAGKTLAVDTVVVRNADGAIMRGEEQLQLVSLSTIGGGAISWSPAEPAILHICRSDKPCRLSATVTGHLTD